MGETKVTIMVIKVDLQCEKCYKKIKKVLCKFPQVRDQIYDERHNLVTIKVVCCSPEKIRKKICCKGGDTVKSIEIVEPEKPKPPPPAEKPKEPEKKPEKPKEPEKKPEKPKEPEKKPEPPKQPEKPPKQPEPAPKPPPPAPAPVPQPCPIYPIGVCCAECYGGRGGGPCHQGYGYPPRFYDGYYGTPVCDSWGGGGYYAGRCENTSTCSIM